MERLLINFLNCKLSKGQGESLFFFFNARWNRNRGSLKSPETSRKPKISGEFIVGDEEDL